MFVSVSDLNDITKAVTYTFPPGYRENAEEEEEE
jgi:hypothetical protein